MRDMKEYLKQIDEVIEKGPYKDDWSSLSAHPLPKWFQNAKFGIFIHWGVYSVPAFGSEWYSRNMYIQGSPEFEHHVKTYGPHKDFGYKDFIPMFKAEKFNAGEWAQLFEEALDEDGIAYEEYTAADSNEIQTVVNSAIETCDAIYIPTDNTMASNTQIVNNICMPAQIPVIAGEQGICSGCGIATLSISYYDIGYTAGEMAYQVLAEGEDISTMEIQTAPEVTKMYNPTICEELGIEIPEDYEAIETE